MIGRAAVAAFLLAALAAPASADDRSETLLRDFLARIDASAEWSASAAGIRSEGADTLAEGVVFTHTDPQVSVSVEELRISDLKETPDGGFTADAIELKGGAAVADTLDYSMPRASVKDVSIPAVGEIAFDPHHIMSSLGALYSAWAKAEFSDFSIPEMSLTQRQAGEGSEPVTVKVVYRNLSSSGLHGGVMEKTSAGPITFAVTNPGEGDTQFEIQSISGERMDFGAFAHILDEKQYRDGRGDGVWRPLLSRAGYSGFSGKGPEGVTFSLAEVAIENVDGRQPDKPFTATWDRLMDPSIPDDVKSDLALEAVRDIYSAWRVGTMRVGGLSVDVPAEQTSFSLGGITVSGLSNQGIDSFILKNLAGKSPGGFASLDSFEFAGFVFPNLDALMKFAALENDASVEKHEETMRATFAALPRLAHLALNGLKAGLSEAESVSLKSFTLDLRDWNDIFAQSTDIRLDDLEVPRALVDMEPQAAEMFDQLGYDRLVYGMTVRDRWSAEAGTDDATWTVGVKDAADVEISYSLVGVTVDWMLRATAAAGRSEDGDAALKAMLNDIRLKRATVKVTDRSLLDRGFGVAAKMQGLAVEGPAYREQMRAALPFLLSAAVPPDITKLLSVPLQGFLAGGQTLIAEVAPAEPVPVTELAEAEHTDPSVLIQRLGVSLRSEGPAQ